LPGQRPFISKSLQNKLMGHQFRIRTWLTFLGKAA
jgi:hypothetical protein